MQLACFYLCLLATVSYLIGAATSYTINDDCGSQKDLVDGWIQEAIYILGRASKVLEEDSSSQSVQLLLNTCLNKPTDSDIQTILGFSSASLFSLSDEYLPLIGYFSSIINSLNDAQYDLDFKCTDPVHVMQARFPVKGNEDGSNVVERTVYPVSLARIGGEPKMKGVRSALYNDGNFLLFVEAVQNYAYSFWPRNKQYDRQIRYTGSGKKWRDIVLKRTLELREHPEENWSDVSFEPRNRDWSLKALTRDEVCLFTVHPPSLLIIHELLHLDAMGDEDGNRM